MNNNLTFEKAMEELEKIIRFLEDGDIQLEDALKTYEKGILLSRHCNKILEEAEEKVVKIIKEGNSYKEVDFSEEL